MDTLLIIGLISSFMALVIFMHRYRATRPPLPLLIPSADRPVRPRVERRPRAGYGQPVQPSTAAPAVGLDAELFRILDDARLCDLTTHRQARTQGRHRPGLA